MNRTVAIGFVVYHPKPILMARVALALDSGFSVFVFDNSPSQGDIRDFCKGRVHCSYVTCGKNVGLGIGLSAICAQAYYSDFRALIFFDQDTVFRESTLAFVEDYYTNNVDLGSEYSAIVFNAKDTSSSDTADAGQLKDVLMAISSGSLFFLENLRRIGWHDQSYFVDCVDYEFCLNSHNHQLKIGEYSRAPGFDHRSEQSDEKYLIFGKERMIRKYSARRVRDTLTASARLMLTSIRTGNLRFFVAMARSASIYVGFQVLVRLIDFLKLRKWMT